VGFACYHLSQFLEVVWISEFLLMSDGQPIAIMSELIGGDFSMKYAS